jgi:DNA-binding MarR family transcriptional regulator
MRAVLEASTVFCARAGGAASGREVGVPDGSTAGNESTSACSVVVIGPSEVFGYTCNCKHFTDWLLRMQVHSQSDVAGLLDRLVAHELPSGSGLEAWDSFLRAHATLMRRLEVDLTQATGLALADFDVLAQLARAGGELRMTDLAARTLISRSGMTRRVARLVEEGLVRRANADADARGVVIALTDAGVARLTETAPVHLRGVSEKFVAQLDDQELAVLKNALDKVTVDCTFG